MFGWGNKGPTPAQKQIGEVLFNDALHVLSSFELNRIASLTYGDDVCDEIFEILESVQAKPMEHSILTVQKSLVITKHVLIYGSEKCVNSSLGLRRGVETLLEFNTVLWAQKLQGAAAMMYRLKGGGVDKGFVVREAAKEVWPIMTDVNKLRQLRNNSADPNSLVPIGNDKVAFLSDEVRHYMLKKRIQEQYHLHTKSNLYKPEGGFGSGYASKDGKSVVGAAHGLEEMMKQAEIANRKFSDQGDGTKYEIPDLKEIMAMPKTGQTQPTPNNNNNHNFDLLGGVGGAGHPQQGTAAGVGDLLDFSAGMTPQTAPSSAFEGDLLGTGATATTTGASSGGSTDLLGTAGAFGGMGDLLGTATATTPAPADNISIFLDPTAAAASHAPAPSSNGLLDFGSSTPAAPTSNGGLLDFGSPPAISTNPDASAGGLADPMSLMNLSSEPTAEKAPAQQVGDSSATSDVKTNVMGGSMMMGGGSAMGGSVMNSSNADRFAALDSLEVPGAKTGASILSAKEAENRLLGQTSSLDMSSTGNGTTTNSSKATEDPAPAASMPGAFISSGADDDKVSQFMSATGAGPEVAASYLDICRGNIQIAVSLFTEREKGGGESGGVPAMPNSIPPVAPPAMPSSMPPVAPDKQPAYMSLLGLGTLAQGNGMGISADPGEFPMSSASSGSGLKIASLNISSPYGGGLGGDADGGDDDDGFVMGGSSGTGLIPTAAAPAAPPPPPPPPM